MRGPSRRSSKNQGRVVLSDICGLPNTKAVLRKGSRAPQPSKDLVFELEDRRPHSGPASTVTSEWLPALHAARAALVAFRDATAHRSPIPTISDTPGDAASTAVIRDWISEVLSIIAANRAGRILLSDIQFVLNSPTMTARYLHRVADDITDLHDINRGSRQRGSQSWGLPSTADHVIPTWTSRRAWLAQVEHALTTQDGIDACATHRTTNKTVLHHAAVYAEMVDGHTGHGLTASRATIIARTTMSASAEQRARRTLTSLGLLTTVAVGRTLTTGEHLAAALHHGRSQSRAASTVHLTTPRHLAHIRPPAPRRPRRSRPITAATRSGRDHLSSSGISPDKSFSSGTTHQTRADARRRNRTSHRPEPRAGHLQHAAAELLHRMPGVRVRHIGSICQVIETAGIDTTVWTGADIAAALDRDTQQRGWLWPASIDRPAAFLTWRLQRMDWTGLSPSAVARRAAERRTRDRIQAAEDAAERRSRAATPDARRAALTAFRSDQAAKKNRTSSATSCRPGAARKITRWSDSPGRAAARAELAAARGLRLSTRVAG